MWIGGTDPAHRPDCIFDVENINCPCICPALRACEARVTKDAARKERKAAEYGYRLALGKAIEAVAAVGYADEPPYMVEVYREDALAAIRDLRVEET